MFILAFFLLLLFYLEEMSKSVRHLICPAGGTVGDLIDCTPREVMAKVMLEDRHFKTWFHGRTVLLGHGKGFFVSVVKASICVFRLKSFAKRQTKLTVLLYSFLCHVHHLSNSMSQGNVESGDSM